MSLVIRYGETWREIQSNAITWPNRHTQISLFRLHATNRDTQPQAWRKAQNIVYPNHTGWSTFQYFWAHTASKSPYVHLEQTECCLRQLWLVICWVLNTISCRAILSEYVIERLIISTRKGRYFLWTISIQLTEKPAMFSFQASLWSQWLS